MKRKVPFFTWKEPARDKAESSCSLFNCFSISIFVFLLPQDLKFVLQTQCVWRGRKGPKFEFIKSLVFTIIGPIYGCLKFEGKEVGGILVVFYPYRKWGISFVFVYDVLLLGWHYVVIFRIRLKIWDMFRAARSCPRDDSAISAPAHFGLSVTSICNLFFLKLKKNLQYFVLGYLYSNFKTKFNYIFYHFIIIIFWILSLNFFLHILLFQFFIFYWSLISLDTSK